MPLKIHVFIGGAIKGNGTIRLKLERNYPFACTPWKGTDVESWRLFKRKTNYGFVYYGNGETEDYAEGDA